MEIEKLWIDLETYSETPIKNGTYRYAEDSEIMLMLYAFDDSEAFCWDVTTGVPMPRELEYALYKTDCEVWASNSMFDRNVKKYNGIDIPIERWRDTMVQALCHALPGGLDKLCEIFGIAEEDAKLKDGRSLIQLFCKPRPKNMKLRRATRETHPEQWARFIEYGKGDIRAMRALHKAMPKFNYPNGQSNELANWHLDQKINDRGFRVDLDLVNAAIAAVKIEKESLKQQAFDLTNGAVTSATKRDQVLEHILLEYGIPLPDLTKATLERRLNDPDIPRGVKELLAIRLQATTTSTSKYVALQKAANNDGRCRGTIQFGGASRTLRAAGRTFQPQNLPSRGLLEDYEIDFGIDALKAGEANFFYPNIMKLLSSCVRGVLIAPPGKMLAVADLSNIEGRFAAWVSGEAWKVQAFRDYDTFVLDKFGQKIPKKDDFERVGNDLYNLAYARAFHIAPEEVTKAQRSIGKVMELACLHPDTQVLTNNGIKRIVEVLITDKLWDGEQWVKHKGLVARGVRQIVNVGGTEGLTPDHLVLTGKTWRPVSELVSNENILSLALETGSAALKSLGILTRLRVKSRIACLRVAYVVKRTLSGYGICVPEEQLNVRSAVLSPKEEIERNYTDTKISYLMRGKDTGCYLGYHPRLLDATPRTINSITLTGAGAYPCLVNGVRTEENFSNISSPFLDGVCRVSKWTERITTKVMNLVTYVSSVNSRIIKTVGLSSTCRNESMSLSPVYDIAHVGARNRFMILTASGPLMVHNCGYAGGVGAFLTMALGYGFDLEKLAEDNWDTLPDELVKEANSFYGYVIKRKMSTFGLSKEAFITSDVFKRVWRESNPNIASMWTRLEEAIRSAISNPQEVFEVGEFIKVLRNKNWLRIRLPSGRSLCYANPRLSEKGEISYMGLNNYTRQWQRLKGYGGLFLENICQAGSRDILYGSMPRAEAAGFQIVLHVHDELVTEFDPRTELTLDNLCEILAAPVAWAPGLPLSAAGFVSDRYKK